MNKLTLNEPAIINLDVKTEEVDSLIKIAELSRHVHCVDSKKSGEEPLCSPHRNQLIS